MGGSRQQTQTSTQRTETNPWAPLQPYLTDLWQRGTRAVDQMPAGPNQTQLTAANWLRQAIPGTSAGSDELRSLGVRTARGDFLDPATNPWIQGAVDAAQRPLRQQLNQNILDVGDYSSRAGAYGGSADALMRSSALTSFNTAALDSANEIYYNNYLNERQLQQNAPGLLQAANALSLQPGMLLGNLGDQEFQWQTEIPFLGLDRLAQLLSLGSGYGTSNSTGTQTVPGQSRGGSVFSGALGGASAGSAFGPWGAGIGAILGGLGGLF